MPFSNPIVGGNGVLIRDAISSPDFVTGVSGWTIRRDGTAEFNGITIRGSIQSANYTRGSGIYEGWRLDNDGEAEFADLEIFGVNAATSYGMLSYYLDRLKQLGPTDYRFSTDITTTTSFQDILQTATGVADYNGLFNGFRSWKVSLHLDVASATNSAAFIAELVVDGIARQTQAVLRAYTDVRQGVTQSWIINKAYEPADITVRVRHTAAVGALVYTIYSPHSHVTIEPFFAPGQSEVI